MDRIWRDYGVMDFDCSNCGYFERDVKVGLNPRDRFFNKMSPYIKCRMCASCFLPTGENVTVEAESGFYSTIRE